MKILKTLLLLLTISCNRDPASSSQDLSWDMFHKSGIKDSPGYPEIIIGSIPVCENLTEPYIIINRTFQVALFEEFSKENQMNKQFKFTIITKSGDHEEFWAPFRNANIIARFYTAPILITAGTPRSNNKVIETNMADDSLAVLVHLANNKNLLKTCPIFSICPENKKGN